MCSAQEEGKDGESSEWCHAYFLQVKIPEFGLEKFYLKIYSHTEKTNKEGQT
jgi:hypothetical protein